MGNRLVRFGLVVAIVVLVLLIAFVPIPGTGEAFRGVILGAVIAGVVGIGGEWLRSEREAQLDSTKRRNDRRIESDRIQRDNLLSLQADLNEWIGAMNDPEPRDKAIRRALSGTELVLAADLRERLRALLGLAVVGEATEEDYGFAIQALGVVLRTYLEPPSET
jgi:hypothetical protein